MTIDYLPWNRPVALADRVCIRDANAELTYAEVARRVDAVAGQFAAAGVGRGDVVAVMLPNRVELLLGLMAAWRLGAAATPVNPVFTANEAGSLPIPARSCCSLPIPAPTTACRCWQWTS